MPSPDAILEGLTRLANEWTALAVAWHAFFGVLLAGAWTRRLDARALRYLLTAPVVSVSVLAWTAGNAFNGAAFAALSVWLAIAASKAPRERVRLAAPVSVVMGGLLAGFGLAYPHFVEVDSWVEYAAAAPLGLLPCPTLAAVAGTTLAFDLVLPRTWGGMLAAAGLLYGAIGLFVLGVQLDAVLLGGAGFLAAVSARRTGRHAVRPAPERAVS